MIDGEGTRNRRTRQTEQLRDEPKVVVMEDSQFGFTEYAEKLNGRLAMIGFVALVALEAATGHGIIGFFQSL